MLRIVYRNKPRRLPGLSGYDEVNRGLGPKGRIEALKKIVTELVRHERLEGALNPLDESRGYAELLIQKAQKHGNKHKETMELADFWLNDKDLIPKLFEVLAPRYANYETSYTSIYRLPTKYPGRGTKLAILELKGNPYPPVLPKPRDMRGTLTNVLIEEMRKDFYKQKYQNRITEPVKASTNGKEQTVASESASEGDSNDSSGNHSLESESYHKDAHIDVKGPKSDGTPV